jgi:SAM-dependent methyltransferase
MDKIARQAAHFDSVAASYRASRQHANHRTIKELMWGDFLADKDALRRTRLAVLEPMCGFADGHQIVATYLGADFTYRGFDFSRTVVDSLELSQPHLDVWHGDVTRFEADAEYDLIILLGGLHHVPDHAGEAVARLARALKPGGHFLNLEATEGNRVFGWIRRWIYTRNSLFDAQTERAFERKEYFRLFEAAGLDHVDSFYPGLLAYVLYYNPDAFPWLNVGGPSMVRALWALERRFRRNAVGAALSFATLSLWQRPGLANTGL